MIIGFKQVFPWGEDWYRIGTRNRKPSVVLRGTLSADGTVFTDVHGDVCKNVTAIKLKGEPTYFLEKILAGIEVSHWEADGFHFYSKHLPIMDLGNPPSDRYTPKIHSIREGERWAAGKEIHMAYGVRTKNYYRFNGGFKELQTCLAVQHIRISWTYKNQYIETQLPIKTVSGPHGTFEYYPQVWIDNKPLSEPLIEKLAVNDGFKSAQYFFRWFRQDFSGQIIHWTPFRYET